MANVRRKTVIADLERLIDLLRGHPDGLRREALEQAYTARYGTGMRTRTLLRRLERLVIERRVATDGEGRSTTYRIAERYREEDGGSARPEHSAQGLRLRALVSKPLAEREPAGYDIAWLRRYIPGTSWYLTKADRARLHSLGRTADDERPAGTFARDILGRLLIDLSWASSRMEGNTYSRLDTQNLLEFGQRAEGKDASEAQMILNHKAAIEYLVDAAPDDAIRPGTILALHALLSENLLGDPHAEGRLRERPVDISGSSYTPTAIPQLIDEAFQLIVDKVNVIPDPFEQAFFLMVHIPYLQPFIDVNKRTSRLAANLPLIRANLCPHSFVGADDAEYVSGTLAVYEHRRTELLRDFFLTSYERSATQYRVIRTSLPTPDPLRLRYRDQLGEVVHEIVNAGLMPDLPTIRQLAARHRIAAEDQRQFEEMVLELLLNLNEASATRYRLRPTQFRDWQTRARSSNRR